MSATLEDLKAGGAAGPGGDLAAVADLLDMLAAYEHAAGSCAGAMIAEGGPAAAIAAALSSLDVVAATRAVVTRSKGDETDLIRQLLASEPHTAERWFERCGDPRGGRGSV